MIKFTKNYFETDKFKSEFLIIFLEDFAKEEKDEILSILHSEDFMENPSESNLILVNIVVKKMLGFKNVIKKVDVSVLRCEFTTFKEFLIDSDDLLFEIIEFIID
jgi:hypothetical protein